MSERGFTWATYVTDDGRAFAIRVDAGYATDLSRGLDQVPASDVPVLGRGWLPRRVFGFDSDGRRQTAVVGSTTADLWTGVVQTFEVSGTDEQRHTVDVVGLLAEHLKPSP